MTKFSQMKYERADIAGISKKYSEITQAVKEAKGFDETLAALAEHEKICSRYSTMGTLAYIRHTIDTRNEFYSAEQDFYDENDPLFEELVQAFTKELFESRFRPQLEERFGSLIFKNIEISLKTFKPEIIPDLQEENRLTVQYQKLIAGAQIEFDRKSLNLSQLAPYKENPDREIRKAASFAEGAFYMENAQELDRIFDELVQLRTKIAKALGFSSFTELGYLRSCRNCYGPEDVAKFRAQVVESIVPIVDGLKKRQSERIGIPDMKIYDGAFGYKQGNPKPNGSAEDILDSGKKMYHEMSPETAEFIDFLYENELLDVVTKKGKAVGGYCTEIIDYKSPFIFSNFNGTSGDVDVLTHEAGHAFAAHCAKDFELLEQMSPTAEACEVHSMSMEFLAWPWLGLFYGEDSARAKFMHLEGALVFIPYGTMVDHFQHIIYDKPFLTPAQRHEVWAELEQTYRPYLDFDDVPFYSAGRGWQRQLHIYEVPFYYIDYCLAQTVALNVWAESQEDFSAAWKKYVSYTREGGKKTFVDLCKAASLPNPLESGGLEKISSAANSWLNNNNL